MTSIVTCHGREHSRFTPLDKLGPHALKAFTGQYDLPGSPIYSEGELFIDPVHRSPYKIDTASFVVETRYGVWGAQVPLKPKGHSKKKRTFGPVELRFMDGVEGRFVGLLPEPEKQNLH